METWAARVAEAHGFSELSHTAEIFGLCRDCAVSDRHTRRREGTRGEGGGRRVARRDGRTEVRPRGPAPSTVRRLDSTEAAVLAGQSAVFEDLQYVLRCCERLVGVLARASRTRRWSRRCGPVRSSGTCAASPPGPGC